MKNGAKGPQGELISGIIRDSSKESNGWRVVWLGELSAVYWEPHELWKAKAQFDHLSGKINSLQLQAVYATNKEFDYTRPVDKAPGRPSSYA